MTNPILVQRFEGAAWLAAGVFAFDASSWAWWVFFVALIGVWVARLAGAMGGHPDGIHFENGMLVQAVSTVAGWFGG